MNIKSTLKRVVLLFLVFFTFSFSVNACIGVTNVFINSEVDNLDGTCTYEVSIILTNSTTATTADVSVSPGSISNCSGGSCTGVSVSPGGTVTATITKLCGEEVKISFDGFDMDANQCGQGFIIFTGLEPLPAELTSFKAEQETRTNKLVWETASEENTLAF